MPPADYYEESVDGEYYNMHFENDLALRSYHKLFISKYKDINRGGRVLEIGCGDGRFLKKMKDLGWDIYGLDFDKHSVENAISKCGTDNIYCCTLGEYVMGESDGKKFDLITFFEVLEHQPNPLEFISNVRKLLKEKGSIAGSVPDRGRYIVPVRFSPDNPPHHFTLWTRYNISSFLERNNFSIDRISHTRFEPIFLNQIINYAFYKEKKLLWEGRESGIGNQAKFTFKQKIKRLMNPFLNVIKYFELPFIFIFKKSVCLLFIARYNE
jgi:SAM-dependent methyltransferase